MSLVYTTHVQFCRARTPLLTSIFPSASCALSICPIRVRCAYMHECVLCEWLLSNSVSVHIFWLVHVSFHIIFCQKRAGRCKIKINFGKKDGTETCGLLVSCSSWIRIPEISILPLAFFFWLKINNKKTHQNDNERVIKYHCTAFMIPFFSHSHQVYRLVASNDTSGWCHFRWKFLQLSFGLEYGKQIT